MSYEKLIKFNTKIIVLFIFDYLFDELYFCKASVFYLKQDEI